MRAVIQRVSEASVTVDGRVIGAIGRGLLILLGVGVGDTEAEAKLLAEKSANLRIFADDEGRFNRSLLDIGGEALVVSQFTLYADTRRGRRPSFSDAAPPEIAAPLVEAFANELQRLGIAVGAGQFGAMMQVALVNDGPVTILLDSAIFREPRNRHER
ncbi:MULTISPECIES: D-aminoacyl-tRNA deacylase [Roseiflexus]|jgi:D-tyrosyl-tRNA(Tyr) deacylase|uniref:D-aminoacyl-tRNA deacylase n=1 Tax=Roseiflexus castenholzii (strain DSM 13941 / HLO8) TaxID=383372 RepID=DTD_ROSCS|nr:MULTISPECIES: D-aminoacyl-tRNA deacylase [Roseiflexus]A7NLC3.1 RecName: Full=D-aminoacyl-tRNA deacylase; Short=DTD; AltName: Full=Gly-tRNA(Ala) deacylase [Roseiflexus castenholzii DSM 13941]ABU58306.1 D-tyrosyl-tRNA(Tyr) deacylase [Roseiflexus castenholzii DSM 13941]GIW01249.1 MAG: D-aminoacyl-tRNA deacylase [Roseiflexus sp.]